MNDYLVRAIAFNGLVRAVAIDLTNTVDEAQQRHNSMPTATAALGRLMVAAAAMSSTLKNNQKIALQICGNGPLETIIAECNWLGHIRGYVKNPHLIIPPRTSTKLNISAGVGNTGMLYVTKDLGFGKPYRGSVELISGEIALDIAQYYVVSKQIPTLFAAGVLVGEEGRVKHAGGYLIQLLPGATEEIIDVLEKKSEQTQAVTTLLSMGLKPDQILEGILGDKGQFIGDKTEFAFKCSCSKRYLEQILITLGSDELTTLLDQEKTEVCCQFCSKKYNFSKSDIQKIISKY